MTDVIIKPKQPQGDDWLFIDRISIAGYPAERWAHAWGCLVISAVEVANDEGAEDLGPEYHISVSFRGGRFPASGVPWLLQAFDMQGADEDNHVPGIARNFWKPVADKFAGYVCACKATETAVVEGDYVWRPLDASK